MRLHLSFSLVVLTTVAAGSARATEYYVSPTGSDSAAGTTDAPWATLQKAANTAVAGDTVWIHGGTYKITTPASSSAGVNFTKSGTSDTNRIKYWAVPGELPVIDFSGLVISTTGYTMGFNVTGSYLHFKGLEICNVPMNMYSNNGVSVGGSAAYDIFESLNMHHNSGNGIFIGNKSGGGHLVLNCDAHDNYDPNSNQGMGQNADGFGVHYQTTGATTIIRGCRAWWNSDDGYDLINQEVPVTVESSWAMGNGYANYGATNPTDGNGNGFKMGSSKTGVRHLVQGNVAWKNKASGFYANHSTGGNTWYNNTSFQNGTQYNMLASPADMPDVTITLSGDLAHIMRNNIGFPNRNSNMTGVDTMFNSWDLSLTPANADFASVTDPSAPTTGQAMGMSIESSGALGPRAADGTMPKIDFLKLAMGSKFIDKGTDVGLPFVGTAPDLGAYEYGATTSSGSGGATGAGGSAAGGRGGTTGTGGRGGTTGAAGRGGTTGAAGSVVGTGTGGSGPDGAGTAGTGGASAPTGAGGASAPTGAGGATTTGTAGTGTTTGTGGNGPGQTPGPGGCSCALDAGRASLSPLALLGALSGLIVARRRQTRSRK
jgi:hypothetical protein